MPKSDNRKSELKLGTRQFFGVFCIVVVLLGVFFGMGYLVSQNSLSAGRNEAASGRKPVAKPLVVDLPEEQPPESVSASPPEAPKGKLQTQRPSAPTKPAPARVAPPVRAATHRPVAGETYLQLAATGKDQAAALVGVLRKNSVKALDYEVPEKPGLFRVLVGPIREGEMNKFRAELQGKGFQGREAIRKTF